MESEELLVLLLASTGLAVLAARAARSMPARRLIRRMLGFGALVGAMALALAD